MITDKFLDIRQIRTVEELQTLERAAKEDNHGVLKPSVSFQRGGHPIGYAGIGTVPMVTYWMDTKQSTVLDSMTAWSFIEGQLHCQGQDLYMIPLRSDSPYFKLMEKAGFVKMDYTHVFAKGLH